MVGGGNEQLLAKTKGKSSFFFILQNVDTPKMFQVHLEIKRFKTDIKHVCVANNNFLINGKTFCVVMANFSSFFLKVKTCLVWCFH